MTEIRRDCPHLVIGAGGSCEWCFEFVGYQEAPYDPAPERAHHLSSRVLTVVEEAERLRRKLHDLVKERPSHGKE
jgi:hypothetical protein